MIRPGFVSITFRKLTVKEIIAVSLKAGIEGIEWGGDIHVPHGDIVKAEEVGRLTREAGLEVVSYGSYYKFDSDGIPFSGILDTAAALKTSLIRVWAGKTGSALAAPEYYRSFVDKVRKAGDLCQKAGIRLAFESHGDSLTDTNESALKLMQDINHPSVFIYWQPPVGMDRKNCLQGIEMIKDYLQWIHVFHWEPDFDNRRNLSEGIALWRDYFAGISKIEGSRWALLEYVKDDSLENFYRDAYILKRLLNDCS